MYNDDPKVAAAQKVMLEILIEVHKICVKYNLTYWLEAGTLLGAIRHKGFIPWDDDCDISMPRDDYERFLEIAERELPSGFFLQWSKTDPGYQREIAKVRKLGTRLVETGETGQEDYCHGIFIDIFPYDYYKYKWFVQWMRWTCLVRDKKKKYRKGSIKRVLVTLYTNVLLLIPVEISKMIKNYFAGHAEYFQNTESKYFTMTLYHNIPRVTKTKHVLPVKLLENAFEGQSFYVPCDCDSFLRSVFGKDYMQLPPLEARKTHAKEIEV